MEWETYLEPTKCRPPAPTNVVGVDALGMNASHVFSGVRFPASPVRDLVVRVFAVG